MSPFFRLVWDLRFDKFPKKDQRFLPAEIACLSRNDVGHTFLQNVHFRSTGYFLQRDRHAYFSRQVWIVEGVRVANPFMWHEFEVLAAKGVALARGEIGKGHLERATNSGIHMMHLARKSIWRQPFRHGVRVKERPVNPFWCCTKHAMKSNSIGSHD